MIPFILIYRKGIENRQSSVRHYVIPQVGEKVVPPGESKALTVLTVEHDIDSNKIWVALS